MNNNKKRIALFASGTGTNAEQLMNYFSGHPSINVALLLSNKKNAGALEKARRRGISTYVFSKNALYNRQDVLQVLLREQIDLIVLAGFMLLVPELILAHFKNSVINIHPALLPHFGGKGMYGKKVHEAVLANGHQETGITIHYADSQYDKGPIIFQKKCPVDPQSDTVASIEAKVHALEYKYYPRVIEAVILGKDLSSIE